MQPDLVGPSLLTWCSNFERIDFLIDQDLQTLAREYGELFNTAKVDRKLIWAASRASRKGLARGMQVSMEVDTLVQCAVDQDEARSPE